MEIPYSILLYIFIGLVGVYFIFSLFDLYHIIRFGFFNGTTATVTFIFLAVSALILFISYEQLRPIDWSDSIKIELPVSLAQPTPQ